MFENKKVIAVIPARGGSKGLKRKNIKPFAGKPLVYWSINAAIKSRYIDDVVVDTDAAETADIAEKSGAKVPFLRPAKLASDKASVVESSIYFLKKMQKNFNKKYSFVVLLQPTSPLRLSKDIDSAFEMMKKYPKTDAVVSVTENEYNPYWLKMIDNKGKLKNFIAHNEKKYYQRQMAPLTYKLNGAIYLCKTEVLEKEKTFCPAQTAAYIMPAERSIDIDDIVQFRIAELLFTKIKIGR